METEKISELDTLATADDNDVLVINDVSENDTMKITKQNLIKEVVNKANTNETHIGNIAQLSTTEKSNLVGAVNEVYSDVQSIVESGSNSNGYYVKYGDGTLIQWGRYTATYAVDISLSAVYRGDQKTITFPIAFIDTNFKMTLSAIAPVNSAYLVDEKTTNTMKFYPIAYASRTSGSYSVDFIAIGKWK